MSNNTFDKPTTGEELAEILPKGRLSWSKIWQANEKPEQYYRERILGEDVDLPWYVDLGRIFHSIPVNPDWRKELEEEELEEYEETFDRFGKYVDYPNQESFFSLTYNSNMGPVDIYGYMDGLDEEDLILKEAKTSTWRHWDRDRVESHGQLKLYSLAVLEEYGDMPLVELDSFILKEDPDKSSFKKIKYRISKAEALTVQPYIEQALENIYQLNKAHYEEHIHD